MSTLVSSKIIDNQPIKCILTRIENAFNFTEKKPYSCAGIVKNYVYIPQKRLIA